MRAVDELGRRNDRRLSADLAIRKEIPVAGGMAGGSADAAAALVALDRLWDLECDDDTLLGRGGGLGSDVPFALVGGTALGTGRGELVTPVADDRDLVLGGGPVAGRAPLDPRGLPALGRAAPRGRVARRRPPTLVLTALASGSGRPLAAALHNDLQVAALDLRPDLGDLIERGEAEGALRGMVSGSGPTCVFLCESGDHARAVAGGLLGAGYDTVLTAYGPVAGAHVVEHPDGEPRQPGAGLQGVRRPAAADRGLARDLGGRADRHRRPQRRRQDHPARADDRAGAARLRPGVPDPRPADRLPPPGRRPRRHPHRARGRARQPVRPRVGRRPAHPRGRRGAAGRASPSTAPWSACPAASGAAARWPRCCSATTT